MVRIEMQETWLGSKYAECSEECKHKYIEMQNTGLGSECKIQCKHGYKWKAKIYCNVKAQVIQQNKNVAYKWGEEGKSIA
jgi:hypothetical protein